MPNENNSNSNNPNHSSSNDNPAEAPQSNVSANVTHADLVSALTEDYPSEPVTDHGQVGKTAGHGGMAAPSVRKKLGNKNALLHGVYSRDFILPWESEDDFETLHKEFRDEWKPNGRSEGEAILALTQWIWMRHRVVKTAHIRFFRSPVADGLKSGKTTWDEVVRYQAKVPEIVQKLISSMRALVDSLKRSSDRIADHYYWTNTDEGKDIQMQLSKMQSDVATLGSNIREAVIEKTTQMEQAIAGITNLFDDAYQPDEIEKQAKLLSMIDREIDKAGKRLIYLRTFKRIEADADAIDTRRVEVGKQALVESPS